MPATQRKGEDQRKRETALFVSECEMRKAVPIGAKDVLVLLRCAIIGIGADEVSHWEHTRIQRRGKDTSNEMIGARECSFGRHMGGTCDRYRIM